NRTGYPQYSVFSIEFGLVFCNGIGAIVQDVDVKKSHCCMTVELFIPCFIDQLFPATAFNTVKVLEKAGCKVVYNPQQTCCGQPAYNAGFWDEAKEIGTKFLSDFSEDHVIVSPSASCTGMVKNGYNDLFTNT